VTNQRLTMVADSTPATQPLPMPETTPQLATSSQGWVIARLDKAEALISASANSTVRRTPKRCIAAAAKGPVKPNRKMPVAAAKLMTLRDQPKALPQGSINTAGVERTPAAANRARNTTATTGMA